MRAHSLDIEQVDPRELHQHPENANSGDIEAIAQSIRINGFFNPLLVQSGTNVILAGNHRWAAALKLGLGEVPAIFLDVDDLEAKRIMVADNRTNRLGRDDPALMLALLNDLHETDAGLAGTGYDYDDYALLASIGQGVPFEDPYTTYVPEKDEEPQPPKDDGEIAAVKKRLPFHVTPVVDDDGFVREIRLERVGLGDLTPKDLNDIRVAFGYAPLSRDELRSYDVPEWRV